MFPSLVRMQPVFSRPGPASRSRSSMCTLSSGADTPPLSIEEGSSQSEGSQSSIDLSSISIVLSNSTYPQPNSARDRVRARARGDGHRRRISQAPLLLVYLHPLIRQCRRRTVSVRSPMVIHQYTLWTLTQLPSTCFPCGMTRVELVRCRSIMIEGGGARYRFQQQTSMVRYSVLTLRHSM